MEKFKIVSPDWTKIDVANAKFILQEAKDYLKCQEDNSQRITNRAFTILSILIPILTALLVFIVQQKIHPSFNFGFVVFLCCSVIALMMVMFLLAKIVFPGYFFTVGRPPRDLCIPEFLGFGIETELAHLALILNEIEANQYKIDCNGAQIIQRTNRLKFAMIVLGLIVIDTLVYLCLKVL